MSKAMFPLSSLVQFGSEQYTFFRIYIVMKSEQAMLLVVVVLVTTNPLLDTRGEGSWEAEKDERQLIVICESMTWSKLFFIVLELGRNGSITWEFVQSFWAYGHFPWVALEEALQEYCADDPLLSAIYLFNFGARASFVLPAVNQSFPPTVELHQRCFCTLFSWTEFLGTAKWRRVSGTVASGFQLCVLQMM